MLLVNVNLSEAQDFQQNTFCVIANILVLDKASPPPKKKNTDVSI